MAALLLEAPQRAVRVDDLYAHLYAQCRVNATLRAAIGGEGGEPTEVFVGDNCRSLTLSMPDSVLSRGSAGIATQVQQWLAAGFPQEARLLVGVGQDNLGMEWQSHAVAPTHVLAATGDGGWTVRVTCTASHCGTSGGESSRAACGMSRWRTVTAGSNCAKRVL